MLGNPDRVNRELARLLTETFMKYGKDLGSVGEVILARRSDQSDVALVSKNRSVR